MTFSLSLLSGPVLSTRNTHNAANTANTMHRNFLKENGCSCWYSRTILSAISCGLSAPWFVRERAYAAACACRFCSFCSFLCLSRSQYARSASLCCCSATSRLCASTSRWSSYCSLWFRFSLSRQGLFLSIIRLSRSFSNAAILLFCVSISLWRDFMILSDLQFRKSRVRWSITSWQRFSSAKIRSIASSTLLISLSFLSNSRR